MAQNIHYLKLSQASDGAGLSKFVPSAAQLGAQQPASVNLQPWLKWVRLGKHNCFLPLAMTETEPCLRIFTEQLRHASVRTASIRPLYVCIHFHYTTFVAVSGFQRLPSRFGRRKFFAASPSLCRSISAVIPPRNHAHLLNKSHSDGSNFFSIYFIIFFFGGVATSTVAIG
jgi:hypothetical protein